jgi:hypothetical protein
LKQVGKNARTSGKAMQRAPEELCVGRNEVEADVPNVGRYDILEVGFKEAKVK